MASQSRVTLKTQFAAGTAATATKFENLIDSAYNTAQDSVLIGPLGLTGTNGLVGPSGATHYNGLIGPSGSTHYNGLLGPSGSTHYNGLLGPSGSTHYNGLWLLTGASAPTAATSSGTTGSVIVSGTGIYICSGLNSWILVTGSVTF